MRRVYFAFSILMLAALACSLGVNAGTPSVLPQTVETATSLPVQSALASGNHNLSMTVDGLERTYILHVPPADTEPLPLIIVLHGTYGTGRKMQFGLGFDPYADRRGFYVAYPDAYQKPGERETARWNDGRGTLESSLTGIDDVKFIVSMVDDIAAQVPLDKSRVFVTGASNGGMMTYRLGCETSGIFAGIAPVIGDIPEPIFGSCSPQAPLKFLAINGDADPFVPFNGGEVCTDVPSLSRLPNLPPPTAVNSRRNPSPCLRKLTTEHPSKSRSTPTVRAAHRSKPTSSTTAGTPGPRVKVRWKRADKPLATSMPHC